MGLPNPTRRPVRRGLLATLTGSALTALLLIGAPGARAAVACPNPVPVVNENNCSGPGSTGYRLTNYNENLAGYSTRTSFDRGQAVPLKIARSITGTSVAIEVYRMGYYGGAGGRLIAGAGASSVPVNNTLTCNAANVRTGLKDCANWNVTYTIPAGSLPASGVYVAKLTSTDSAALQNWVIFTVRDDTRATPAKGLYVLPVNTYQAYNTWGGKSLYYDKNGGTDTIAGPRAVKVSFDRPLDNATNERNGFFGPDFALLRWLEQQGYDLSYTDDVQVSSDPAELLRHPALIISGHSEYWSGAMLANVKAARDAGVGIASFSANTAYWQVRYEDNNRTLVCYKTVQGTGTSGSGALGVNDEGPDGIAGTADDALGLDGVAGTADDHPEYATTTMRDNGAPPGDPNAPPGGRVGPDTPENSLFGVMFVGDHESHSFDLAIPPANASAEFAGDRVWRNTSISTTSTTTIPQGQVGWEWDAIPTQAQYLAKQPAGVKRVTSTNVANTADDWLQDEGRVYANTPPPGQPTTVTAVRYKAASGATVFASGTMQWADGLGDARIAQATYNVLSDMNVPPNTPQSSLVLDTGGSNQPPSAAFTASPNPAHTNQTVTFDASGSTDFDGAIARYEWDLDGNGTYETDTGTTKTVTRAYTAAATVNVGLRVTDNAGATATTTRTLTVASNFTPTASFTATPNPAQVNQNVTFDASASADSDGTIARYEWDLDGNGTYETDTGTTKTVTHAYAATGTTTVGLRVTDDGGATATATLALTVDSTGSTSYAARVLATPGLARYWRMGEAAGPTLADATGGGAATATGGTFGVPGGPPGDPDTAVHFNGTSDSAQAAVDLSGQSKITVEFWLKWDSYANDDRLALELTPNFNQNAGGFLVDPDAPQFNGTFGVAMGLGGTTRNNVFFARPSAGVWHHYALVLDSTAPAATQITPYVDGALVPFQKADSMTGAGPFAAAPLYFMSRGGSQLLGAGGLDELALYTRALSASEVAAHAGVTVANTPPTAAFSATPSPAQTGKTVTFDASASADGDGTIAKYEWDLDGNGTYETDTGTAKTTTKTYATAQTVNVGLRVTDDKGATATVTHALSVTNPAPTAAFTAQPSPATVGAPVTFDASGSTDANGTIARYEWDLDGNGTYETDTGTAKTTTKTYTTADTVPVSLRVTDNEGATATVTVPLTINSSGVSNYATAVLGTAGLTRYWRMGETTGPTLADSTGGGSATVTGGTFAVPGGIANDPNTAVRFNGTSDNARSTVDLSATQRVTVEFWLKWARYANDDHQAIELTANSSLNAGGFTIDPDATSFNGTFGVMIGRGTSRNTAYFARPSAGVWHHYAFVLDTTASASTQIKPYVDGRAVTYQKGNSGTGAGRFAASTLYWMSRAGTSLFGQGDLDELALYNTALSATTIAAHAAASGTNQVPTASFTATPSTVPTNTTVAFDASASADPDGSIAKYEWDLDGNGTYETDTGTTKTTSRSYSTQGTVTVRLRVTDNRGAQSSTSRSVVVADASPPPTPVYSQSVLSTAGLRDYWRMGDPGPTVLTDATGRQNATLTGGTPGVPGAPAGGTDTAVRFNGSSAFASVPVDLSTTSKVTIEFWLKWNIFGSDDALAMELTPNFNANAGGFLVDPNAGQFAVAIGVDGSRNNVFFTPPSAGVWHHYAFVIDAGAPAATQILPYVDGQAVPFTKNNSGTGAGAFANSTLYFMSRGGSSLFGAGDLDEVALYTSTLSAATIAAHATAPPG